MPGKKPSTEQTAKPTTPQLNEKQKLVVYDREHEKCVPGEY